MKKIKFYWSIISLPFVQYVKWVYHSIKLKSVNPTLKLEGRSRIFGTKFGLNNFVTQGVTLIKSELGDFSYVGENSFIQNVTIGRFTCIGPSVKIGLGNHPVSSFISIHPVFYSLAGQSAGVTFADKQYFDEYMVSTVGHDVWIGADVVIPGGITIGNGAIIASGAVVTKDVPPYAIVGGVPAAIIRYRFTEEKIQELQQWEWWNKDPQWLKTHFKEMHNIENLANLINQ